MNTNNIILKLKRAEDAVASAKQNLQQVHAQIGPVIKKLRMDHRLKQGAVARAAKLHQSQLYLVEQGAMNTFDVAMLNRIVRAIDNQTEDL